MQPLVPEPESIVKEHRSRLAQWRELQLRQAVELQLQRQPGFSSQWQGTLEVRNRRAIVTFGVTVGATVGVTLRAPSRCDTTAL